jgi:hypothetical protein
MRVVALERFAEPSRRLDPATPGFDDAVSESVDLSAPGRSPGAVLRALPAALRAWITAPATMRERAALASAAWRTRGARVGAALSAPALLRRVREREIDAIACYSSRDFALATFLAGAARTPCREVLARGTQYFGEFAFELLAVIPYAYWLHRQGRLEFTVSTPDTRCLYWFSPRHVERTIARRYVPITEYPIGVPGRIRYDRNAFPEILDTSRWTPPPYREVFRDDRFGFDRPLCVVCNKATDEHFRWHRSMTNHLPSDLLIELVGRLRSRYEVVYNRPGAADIVNDHQTIRETGDIEALKAAYPDLVTIQELHARFPELGYNELQLRLYAGCRRFVSVLGGSSYLASWFGGVNVVYAKRGWEVACGAYERWFDRFSGARVIAASTPEELLDAVGREML